MILYSTPLFKVRKCRHNTETQRANSEQNRRLLTKLQNTLAVTTKYEYGSRSNSLKANQVDPMAKNVRVNCSFPLGRCWVRKRKTKH